MTYMAPCGEDSCDKFDPAPAQWFKIAQIGQKPNDTHAWYQEDLTKRECFVRDERPDFDQSPINEVYSFNLPQDLPSGNYLLRHEASHILFIFVLDSDLLAPIEDYSSPRRHTPERQRC